jgi:hypothetical protein
MTDFKIQNGQFVIISATIVAEMKCGQLIVSHDSFLVLNNIPQCFVDQIVDR